MKKRLIRGFALIVSMASLVAAAPPAPDGGPPDDGRPGQRDGGAQGRRQRGPDDQRGSQGRPGAGDQGGPGGPQGQQGVRKFELGHVIPPMIRDQLNLSDEQQKQIDDLEKDVKTKLEKLLTDEQKKALEGIPFSPGGFPLGGRQGGQGGFDGPGGPGGQGGPDRQGGPGGPGGPQGLGPDDGGGPAGGQGGPGGPGAQRGRQGRGGQGGPGGPGGPGGQGGPGGMTGRGGANGRQRQPSGNSPFLPSDRIADPDTLADGSLVHNRFMRAKQNCAAAPDGYTLVGDAAFGEIGDSRKELSGTGVRLLCGTDSNKDGPIAGGVSYTVKDLTSQQGRWYRFSIKALAQDGCRVEKDDLFLRVEFLKDHGTNALGDVKKTIYEQVDADRKNLKDAGTNRNLGGSSWRTFVMDFHTPFPEVDAVKLTAGFTGGVRQSKDSEFWINEFDLKSIPTPADYPPPTAAKNDAPAPVLSKLVKLGGRWYFDPRGGDRSVPKQIDYTNSDRLYYLSDRLETPFANNLSAWLRKGYLDLGGKQVEADRFIPDNVIINFTATQLVMHSRDLPNHPTAAFPDRWRQLDGNPNYIQEQEMAFSIPLDPKENPKHVAMDPKNTTHALPMGPIGVAVNGIVFFNPFDANTEEAVWRLDRCCGHPSPGEEYHYHKYPTCLNTPWSDDGKGHSPVIGFAMDGFPVYGPYESAGEMAKDSKTNPLNDFNLHKDDKRGWHYHVTPGKFPHIIGGYWGEAPTQNRRSGGGGPR